MGASGQTNWRIPQGFEDWSMSMEKRLMHEERRKPPPLAGHTYVAGFAHTSNRVFDWNDEMLWSNGYWYAQPGAINGPDPTNQKWFLGRTQVDEDGFGIQFAMEYRPNDGTDVLAWPTPTYQRRFYVPVAGGQVGFSSWVDPTIATDYTSNASGAFSGTAHFSIQGNRVMAWGTLGRASGFNTTFAATGAVCPAALCPAADLVFPGAPFFNTGTPDGYRFRVRTAANGGTVDVQQSVANTQNLSLNGVWTV